LNLPQWDLPKGEYRFRIYPREDGTAFDALAILTPGAEAPNGVHLELGGSTLCPAVIRTSTSLGFSDIVLILMAVAAVAYGLYTLIRRRAKGRGGLPVRSLGVTREFTAHLTPMNAAQVGRQPSDMRHGAQARQ
jgi:hypothetical protein